MTLDLKIRAVSLDPLRDQEAIAEIVAFAGQCVDGEVGEVQPLVIHCQDANEVATQYRQQGETRADSSLFLPYFFRTTPPSLDLLRSKYHSQLIAIEGQTGLLEGALLDPAAMVLRTYPVEESPYYQMLLPYLKANLWQTLTPSRALNMAESRTEMMLGVLVVGAAIAGLEMLDDSTIGRFSGRPEDLDGRPGLSAQEAAASEIVMAGNIDALDLLLLGVFQYLRHRTPEQQLVYVDIDADSYDLSALLHPSRSPTPEFSRRVADEIRKTIQEELPKFYADFSGIQFVFSKPKQSHASTLHFSTSPASLSQFFSQMNPKNAMGLCLAAEKVVMEKMGGPIHVYLQTTYGPDPCVHKPVEYISDPLGALAFLLSQSARGTSQKSDHGNALRDDEGYIFAGAQFVPIEIKLPHAIQSAMNGDMLRVRPKVQWQQIENFGLRNTLDIERIRSFAYSLSVTGAHELGHLLGVDHAPEHLLPGILPTLMSGHGHSFDPTSKLGMATQWTAQEHAYLLLLFGDH